jgi:zinc finger protein
MTQCPIQRRRWFEAADHRHATFGPPVEPGDEVATLCAATAIAVTPEPGRYAPQCPLCDRTWRDAEGIPMPVVPSR